MNPRSCVLLLCAIAGALSVGCTAIHPIKIESNPPGAEIYVIRTDRGTEDHIGTAPYDYKLVSPYAEKWWPWAVTIEARMEGRLTDRREFKLRDPLPQRLHLTLHPAPGYRPRTQPVGHGGDLPDKYGGPAADPGSASSTSFETGPDR